MNKKWIQAICYLVIATLAIVYNCGFFSSGKETVNQSFVNSENSAVSSVTDSSLAQSSENSDRTIESEGEAGIGKAADAEEASGTEKESDTEEASGTEKKSDTEEASGTEKKSDTEENSGTEKKSDNSKTSKKKEKAKKTSEKNNDTDGNVDKSEDTRTYYLYRVTVDSSSLRMYSDRDGHDQVSGVPKDYQGYVISKTDEARSLILYKGRLGYCSNMYLEMTEISAEEYPDELKGLSEKDISEVLLFGGSAAGPLEQAAR